MAMSERLNVYLNQHHATFDLVAHPPSGTSLETAEAAHVPRDRLAKAVVVKERGNYAMVVVPSSQNVDLERLRERLHHRVDLASEAELTALFPDCSPGAIPPIGPAFHMATLWDSRLADRADVYFEAGDHEELIHVSALQFVDLMGDAQCGRFGQSV